MATLVVLIVWAGGLAYHDWRWRHLPNGLLVVGAVVGAIHWVAYGVMPYGASLLDGVLTAALVLVVLWPVYRLGWMGAGDVKFLGTIGWLGGYQVFLIVFLAGALLGGLLGLLILVPRVANLLAGAGLPARLRRRVPYGTALALPLVALSAMRLCVP